MAANPNLIAELAKQAKAQPLPARTAQIVVNNGAGRVDVPLGTDASKLTKADVQQIVKTNPVQPVQTPKQTLSQMVKQSGVQANTPALPTAPKQNFADLPVQQKLDALMRNGNQQPALPQKQDNPNVFERIGSIMDASAKRGQGNFETLWESVGNWAGEKLMDVPVVGDWLEEQLAKPENAYLRESKTPLPYKTTKEIAYETAERDIARAKEGLGKTGQAAVDLASTISDMGYGMAAAGAAGLASAVPVFAAQSAASGIEEAKKNGASNDEALAYGVLKGGLTAVTEKLVGGIPMAGKTLTKNVKPINDIITKVAQKIAKNPNGTALIKRAFDVLGEGAEEALETAIDPLLQRLTYDENADFATGEDLLYSAVMGALASAVFNAPSAVADAINAAKTALPSKNAAANAQTEAETNVQAPPVQDEILPRANVQSEAVTDTDAETSTEPGFFGAEVDTESDPSAEAKAHMDEMDAPPKQEVLHEKKWYEAVYQAQKAGERLGVKVVTTKDLPAGVNGAYKNGVIYISEDAQNPLKATFVHELTHHLEATNTYNELRNYVLNRDFSNVGGLDAYRATIRDAYAKKGKTIDDAGADAEIVANYIEQKLFNNSKEIAQLANKHRGLVQTIRDWFTDLRVKFRGTAEEKELLRAQRLFEKALRETGAKGYQTSGDGRYAVKQTVDGRKYVHYDRKVIEGDDPKQWEKQIEAYINEKIRKGEDVEFTTADGDVLLLTARSAYKLSDPTRKNADGSRSRNRSDYNATKYRAAGHIDELISIADNKRFVPDDGSHKNDIGEDGFDYRQVYFQDYDGKHYQMDLSVAKNGAENTVYSIGDIKERSFPPNTGPSSKTGGAPEGEKASDNANIAQPEDLVKHSSSGSFDTGIGDVLKKAMDKSKGAVTGGQLSVDLGENDLLRASTGRTAEEIKADMKSTVEQYSPMEPHRQPGVREAEYPYETAQGKTMRTPQNIAGSNLVDDFLELDIEEAILAGKFAYEVSGDKAALRDANKRIEDGSYDKLAEQAKGYFADGYRLKKEQVVFVERMIQEATKKGDVDTAMSLITDLAAYGTEQGQNIQALSMIRRMTPEGKLMVLKHQVDKANKMTQVDRESKGEIKKTEQEIKAVKKEAFAGLEDIGVDESMDIETAQQVVDEAIAKKEKELVPFMPDELYTSNPQRDKSYSGVDKVTSEVVDTLKNVGQIDAPKQKEQVENVVKRLKKQRLQAQLDEDLLELQKIQREIARFNKHISKVEVLPTKESIDAERAERKAKLEQRQKQLEERIAQLRKLSERDDLLGTLAYEDIILRHKDDFLTADYREAKQFEYQKERLDKAITTLEEFLKTGEETNKNGPTAAERAEQKRKRLELIAERDDELGKKAKEVLKSENRKEKLESEKKTLEKIQREIENLSKSIEQKSVLPDADSIKQERAERKAALEKQKETVAKRIAELETLSKRDDLIGKKAKEDIELHLKEEAARADYKTAKQLELQKERLNNTIEELSKLKTDADLEAKRQENELKRKAKQDDLVRLSERKDEVGKKAREILALQKKKAELAETQKRVTELRNAAKKFSESVALPKETIEAMLKAKSPSEQNDLYNKALDEIASQIVSSLPDKVNAWRYLAMLGNPRTHIRNVTGNATMAAANAAKNLVKYAIESVPGVKRTTVLKSSADAKAFAKEDFEKNRDLITGGGKMNASDELRDRMTIFKNKNLEALRKFNTAAMEAEDEFFMRKAYESSLARYITANKKTKAFLESGSTAAESFLQKARDYAIREAREVTFHDDSAVADWLSGITRTAKDEKTSTKVAKAMVEGVLPFKKTPINVAKRGIEYSPISVVTALNKFSKGDAAGAVDDLAKGVTGSIMMGVGLALARAGMLRTKNDEKDEVLDTQENEQNYSLRVPNSDGTFTSVSLDALMPAAMPLLVGVEVNKLMQEEGLSVRGFLESLTGIADPIVENSMLDGLNDMLSYVGYSDNAIGAIAADMGESYVEQFRPSILRQIGQSIDPTVRTTYAPKDSPIGKGIETHLRSLGNALPFGAAASEKLDDVTGSDRFSLQPKIDVWGNEVERADSFGARLVHNMVLPFNVKKVTSDPVNEELRRLYNVDSTYSVLPKAADKSFAYQNENYYAEPAEYTGLAKTKGQTMHDYLETTIKDAGYKALPDAKKADVVSDLMQYANYKAKQDFFDGRGINYVTDTFNGVEKAVERGLTAEDYYIMKAQMDGGQTAEEKIPYYMGMLTNEQKRFVARLPKDAASASWLERIALSNQGENAKTTSAYDDILIGEKAEKVDYSDKASVYLSLIDGNANSKVGDKYYEYAKPAGVSVEDYMVAYYAQKDVTYPAKTKGAKAAAEAAAIDKALPNLSKKQREALYQAFK